MKRRAWLSLPLCAVGATAAGAQELLRAQGLQQAREGGVVTVRTNHLYLRLTIPETKRHKAQIVTLRPAVRIYQSLVRHASTVAGLGDPPEFRLGQCDTQRNLSEEGRQAAQAMGQWFRQHGLVPAAVLSSQWCRCQDTARLAFGAYQDWPALNSTFAGQGDASAQLQILRQRLRQMPAGRLEVWVTHQVIMTALTDAYPAMGEAFWVDREGRLLVRAVV